MSVVAVSAGLTVSWQDPTSATAPPGWNEFVRTGRLPAVWDWPIVHAVAAGSRPAVLAATVHDGARIEALVTARFPGLRTGRGRAPLAGVVDVDCLASASLPGIAVPAAGGDDPLLRAEIVAALRDALRREYGPRVRALMFRQVDRDWLPVVLRWPGLVREGGPIALFHNRFADFEGYLAALSKSRRWSLRKLTREIEADPRLAVSFTGRGDPPAELDVSTVCALHDRVVDRHHHRWWLRKRRMPPELARAQLAHPGVHRVTYHDRDRGLLAFALAWDHPQLPDVGTWGAPAPAEGGRDGLWFHFNTLLVRWCIETGRAGVRFGQGNAADKRRLGYQLCRQWAVLVPQLPQRHGRAGSGHRRSPASGR